MSQPPRKHHYLPEFYLKNWANQNGRVWEFSRPHKSVVARERYPSETGFERHLYSVSSRSDSTSKQHLESDVFSPLDNDAAVALAHLGELGTKPSDENLTKAWCRFLVSQLYRNPSAIRFLRQKVRSLDTERLEEEYQRRRSANDPSTVREYMATLDDEFHEESFAKLLPKLLISANMIGLLSRMQWRVIRLKRSIHGLLTSDRPLVLSNGLLQPQGFMTLPIGVNAFFLATQDTVIADAFQHQCDQGRFDHSLNDAVVRQSATLVVAASEHHRRFVENRLGLDAQSWNEGSAAPLTWRAPV
jgi:hypothetical protein